MEAASTSRDQENGTDMIGPADSRVGQPRRHRSGGPRSERGEGVVSTAIVVLIIAFLGIGLWTGFDGMMNSATEKTRTQVEQIGE